MIPEIKELIGEIKNEYYRRYTDLTKVVRSMRTMKVENTDYIRGYRDGIWKALQIAKKHYRNF
ncbi:MAG: hypothetical protein ACTSX6_00165 [Candidatus Heimdallarchaeaceae archaeon]